MLRRPTAALAAALLAAPLSAQAGFDFIGPDDGLSTGNPMFLSQDRVNGDVGVAVQPWTTLAGGIPREVWVVWGVGNQDPSQITEWRVGIWSDLDEVIAAPDAGDLFSLTLAAPDLGDATAQFGSTADGRPTYLIGFSIPGVPLGAGVEAWFGVQAVGDPAAVGVGGVVESSIVAASGAWVDPLAPGGAALVSSLSEAQHSGALAYRVVTDSADFGFCAGDGAGAPCPCGNSGSPGHGCANSAFPGGARMTVTGTPSVSNDTLQLDVQGSRPSQPGLFFQGDNAVGGGAGIPFGDGLRCAGGAVVRLELVSADAAGAVSTSVAIGLEAGVAAGEVKRYQWWYRDPGGSPCGFEFNLSNGVELTWVP